MGGRSRGEAASARDAISTRLRSRRDELEKATRDRVFSVSDPSETDPTYLEGLRGAVGAAIEYGLDVVERGERHAPPIPQALLSQVRTAARNGVRLDVVLRRFSAGHSLLSDFVLEEAQDEDLLSLSVQFVMRDLSTTLDRLMAAAAAEYLREQERRVGSIKAQRVAHVRRLLAGELLRTSEFSYDFDGWHVGVVAQGTSSTSRVRELAASLGRPVLVVDGDERIVWAWLGGQQSFSSRELELAMSIDLTPSTLALGEPSQGMAGWRLTHRQAQAALPVAVRSSKAVVRYSDVAPVASMLQDEVLTTSLREIFLVPLSAGRDGGETLRETLRAYLAAGGNASSAALLLGVSRRTIPNRLKTVEDLLGRPLASLLPGIGAALELEKLGG